MIVTGALSEPSTISPSGPGFANSAGSGAGVSARAAAAMNERASPTIPVPASAKAAAAFENWRRVSVKGLLPLGKGKRAPRMWHQHAIPPRACVAAPRPLFAGYVGRSAAFDRYAKARHRLPQIVVGDLGHGRGQARGGRGVGRANGLAYNAAQRRLTQRDTIDCTPANEAVDAFADHVGEMLDLDRGRPFDADHQNAGRPRLVVDGPGPLDFYRLAVRGDFDPDDLGPTCHQFG